MQFLGFICGILVIAAIIFLVVFVKKKAKNKRSSCPSCKKLYKYPDDFSIIAGELQWRKATREETKGDFKYEITYKIFYRVVTFNFKCSKCGYEHWFNRTYDLYRSDSDHSQSDSQELAELKRLIKEDFDDSVFAHEEIEVGNLDY
jgi:DNA-directed RNA polymerase subunit M/transcription elongation factor TFIIS